MGNAYKILVGKTEGKRPLRRSKHRWYNIKINLRVIWFGDVNWESGQGKVVG
jgi:hypothetical protein